MKQFARRTPSRAQAERDVRRRRKRDKAGPSVKSVRNGIFSGHFQNVLIFLLLIGFLAHSSTTKAASAISLAGIDFHQLCRETAHVPLVQAAIHPAYINVWSVQESREHRRYEQYTFKTQRIDVRVEHDISLYHGLIHRTLDLIGESQWKYRDLPPQEDYEHWLIYHTLEMHWPGMQRRQGNEPTRTVLAIASEYWTQYSERYGEIEAKAAVLARKSWCATNKAILDANAASPRAVQPERQTNLQLIQGVLAAKELPGEKRVLRPEPQSPITAPQPAPSRPIGQAPPPQPAVQPAIEAEPARQARTQQPPQSPAASLATDPIGIGSEVAALPRPAENALKPPLQAQQANVPSQPGAAPAGSPAPISREARVEPTKVLSEFFVALPEVEEKSARPAWPAPWVVSADLPVDPTLPAKGWR